MRIIFILAVWHTVALGNPKVDELFRAYDKPTVPGAAVAIIQDGWVVYQKGYGLAELKDKREVTTATNFRLASLSKQFTAMAVVMLIDRGLLQLETKLTDIFPDFPAYGSKIKIRHLLGHQSGLRDYEDLIPGSQTEQVTDKDVLDILKKQSSSDFTPGSQYRYSNGGYCLLSQIVEKVSGRSFPDFLHENLFNRLGMTHSLMFEKGISIVENRAYGHSPSGSGFTQTDQSVTSATMGDGGVYTSVGEYFLWDQALYRTDLASEELMKAVFTPAKLNDGSSTQYGFGWVLDTYRGLKRQSHTGSTIGFRTAVQRFPEKKFSVVVFVNRANSAPWDIARQIADLYLFPGHQE